MSENRRKSERVPSQLRCWCEAEDVTFYARIGDLSEGGLFLRTSTPLASGTRAHLRLLDGGVELRTGATVRWARADETELWDAGRPGGQPSGMGLEFDALDAPARALLARLLGTERERAAAVARGRRAE